jgi:hypothetical protein
MSVLGAFGLVALLSTPASAQDDGPSVTVTGGIDFTNQYNFRGIRQNTDGVSIWPFVDLGIGAYTGEGALKSVSLNFGTWNAFHSQINEDDFGTGNTWYESDLYATAGLGFGMTSLGVTYTSYTSPADLFAHVKELAFKVSVDDSGALGAASLKPYAVVAFELGDASADGGAEKGTYVELGVAPGVAGARASLAIPIKVGLSANNYYEFGTGTDSKFGYFSIAGVVTVPMGANANIHGGVEFQTFGDNVKAYNGFGDDGDGPATIASIGIGFTF